MVLLRHFTGEARVTPKALLFSDLSSRHPGVSDGISASYAEAVCVCLDRHHISPAEFQLKDNENVEIGKAAWLATDERTKRAWQNKDDATEAGAYGVALAAIEATRGLVAVRRAETRTGADYYLGLPNGTLDDLESAFRLEVSGTDEGAIPAICGRLRQKLDQAKRGNSNVPAIASVVGFAALQIVTADVDMK